MGLGTLYADTRPRGNQLPVRPRRTPVTIRKSEFTAAVHNAVAVNHLENLKRRGNEKLPTSAGKVRKRLRKQVRQFEDIKAKEAQLQEAYAEARRVREASAAPKPMDGIGEGRREIGGPGSGITTDMPIFSDEPAPNVDLSVFRKPDSTIELKSTLNESL